MNYQFHDEARSEYREAVLYYELQRRGLGQEFVWEFEAHLEKLLADPESYVSWDGETRSVNLRRFPYTINYVLTADQVFILSIAHHRRHPRYWRHRWPSESG